MEPVYLKLFLVKHLQQIIYSKQVYQEMTAATFTWAYRDSATLSFSHWDDAAHRCIPIFAAITCHPIAYTNRERRNMLVPR